MTEISLKLKRHVHGVSLVNNNIERLILSFILWSFGILAILYVLFLCNMVRDIIERKALEADARTLSNEVGDLGFTYLTMSNSIDLNLSHSLGFKETKTTFATRKALGFISPLDSAKTAQNEL